MKYTIKKSGKKGMGVFASKNIKKNSEIMNFDLTKNKVYNYKELRKVPKKDINHLDPIGNGKYVVDYSPFSYINHSCNPNSYIKEKNHKKGKVIALKSIKKNEEISLDYTITANITEHWKEKCFCNSNNCRKFIDSEYRSLPKELQIKYFKLLPLWKKRLLST